MNTDVSHSQTKSVFHGMAWLIWFVVTFFYAFQYILRIFPSVMMQDILGHLSIHVGNFGDFSAVYYLGYALAHIPIGLMLDRFRLKWVIVGSVLISILGILPILITDNWTLCVIGRFLTGVGSSGAILSVFKVIRLYFPERLFSRLLSISVTIGLSGAIYGSAPIDQLSHSWGWATILWGFVGVGCCLALICLIFTPKAPVENQSSQASIWASLKIVLTNSRILLTAVFAGLMVGPLEGFADVWGVSFLETVYGFDRLTATALPPLFFIGMGVGAPILAAVAEKLNAYYELILIAAVSMAVIFLHLATSILTVKAVGILFFIVGVFSAYQVLAITLNSQNLSVEYSGLITSITNMIIMAFGFVFHTVISRTLHFFSSRTVTEGQSVDLVQAYQYSILIIPVALILALIGFWGLKSSDQRCVSTDQ